MTKKILRLGLILVAVLSLNFLLSPPVVHTQEIESAVADNQFVPDSAFKVVDEFIDEADLGNGKRAIKIYQEPRLITNDTFGNKKVREEGWNLFNEDSNSRLEDKGIIGYEYKVPFKNGGDVVVRSGQLDRNVNNKVNKTSARKAQFLKTNGVVSESKFEEVYPEIDILFKDVKQWRFKNIIINSKPANLLKNEDLIIWEEISVPQNSEVYLGDKKIIKEFKAVGPVYIKQPNGDVFIIGSAYIYDSKELTDNYRDLTEESLAYKVIYDQRTNLVKIGTIVSSTYLNNSGRVYPLIIDPQYSMCNESGSTISGCSITDLYLRYKISQDTSATTLYMGYYNDAGSPATRQPVVKFSYNFPSLTAQYGTLDSAQLYLKYKNYGLGTYSYNSYISTVARKINTSWNSPLTYDRVRSGLVSLGTRSIRYDSAQNYYTWEIGSAVQDWINGGSNYGVLVEPVGDWPNYSTANSKPNWPDRLHIFYSSRDSGNTGPYLMMSFTAVVTQPDLVINSKSLSKTTVSPGEAITGYVTVRNSGSGSAGASSLGYYYSTDSTCNTSDNRLTTDSVESLTSGATGAQDSASLTIPSNAALGTRYICFIADYGNLITETNENNNSGSVAITVIEPPDPLESNDTYSTATNIGTVTSYSNNNLRLTTSDQDWFKFTYNSKVYYFKVRGFNTTDVGAYGISFSRSGSAVTIETTQIDVSVDTYLELYDSNGSTLLTYDDDAGAGNFSKITSFDLNPLPDLRLSNGTITSAGTLYGGNQIAYSYTIENSGTVASNGVVHSAGIIDVSSGNTYGLLNESPSSWNLIAGYSDTKAMTANIQDDCGMPYEANYRVSVTLDPSNNIPESNDSNNIAETSNNIKIRRYSTCGGGGGGSTPAPDFDSDSYYDPEEYYAGTKITAVDNKPIKDNQYDSYMSKKTDLLAYNFAADPVNIRTGAFEFTQTDFSLLGRGEAINFTRTYNSRLFDRNNRMGNGWSHSYNLYYYQDPTSKNIEIYLGGASAAMYTTTDGGTTYTPPVGEFDKLYWDNGRLVYQKLDGIKYIFSGTTNAVSVNMGVLESIVDTNGNVTTLTYTSVRSMPLLTTITDASGRSITLSYGTASDDAKWDKIVRIQDNVNPSNPVVITYEYDANNNLIHVQSNRNYNDVSDTIHKYFSYTTDGKMLTYTDSRGTILYNTFDVNGRVTEQWEYNPNIDAVGAKRKVYTLEYQGADAGVAGSTHCTLVKNYRDLTNFYSDRVCFNSSELKIYREKGASIERWAYSAIGMPISYTDGNSNVTNYEYDTKRRLTKETLPDNGWRTVNNFVYEDVFNRMTRKTETVSAVSAPTIPVETRVTNYVYDNYGNLITLTDALNNIERREYNTNGTLKKFISKNNQIINYTYDATGNYVASESTIINQADGTAQTITKNYLYDVYGNRTRYTDPKGNIYNFESDTKGNLRKAVNPDSTYQTFTYDVEDHKLTATDELGRTTTYIYDKDINASLLSIAKSGSTVSYQYDWVGNKLKDIDALNRETTYVYDSANRVVAKVDPVKTTSYEYYGNGQLKKEINNGGGRSDYFYDARGNNNEVRRYYDASNYLSNKFEYDGFNRKVKEIDGRNNNIIFTYDLMDRLVQVNDALDNQAKYFYDANGNKTGELNPRGSLSVANRNSLGHSVSYVYDGINRLIKKIDAGDKYTLYFYDANGNLVRTIDRQNSNGTNNTHITDYLYNNLNRQTKITDALGGYLSQTYDAVGNVLTKTDQMNRTWTYTYDVFNRLTDEYDPANNNTHYTYDKVGNKLTARDSQNKITQFQYDSLNRLTKVIDPLNNYQDYGYDLLNNKTSVKDKRGYTTTYVYDKLGRLMSETNPQSIVINYTYDANNNRLTENVAGKITSYVYDELNRPQKRTEPGNKMFIFEYDENGNKISEVDGNGAVISYTYDKLDRVSKKTLPSPEGEINYGYDQWNNLTSLSDLSGTTNYTYDLLNRNTNEAKTINGLVGTFNVGREYFADSGLKSITDVASKKVNYNYNSRGLLDNVVYATNNLAVYTYTSFGKPLTVTYGNGVVTTYSYDELQRPERVETKLGTDILFSQDYTYDKESNRMQMVEYKLVDGQVVTSTVNYTYDSIGQITNADYNHLATTQDLSYSYDVWGNRTSYNTAFGNTAYSYTPGTNEISGFSLNNRLNAEFVTDNNGNIMIESYDLLGKEGKTINYLWNSENKLTAVNYQVPSLGNNILTFVYDDFGNRVKKTVNGDGITYYINNGLTVLNELDANGNVTKTMVGGLNPIAEIDSNNSIKYLNQDILGSVVLITDNTGSIVHQYGYDPFGGAISELGDSEQTTNYLYTGQEFDAESELYYYNARYYNPVLGRFLSKDPITHRNNGVLGYNEYVYVNNNPLKYVDPDGMEAKNKLNSGKLDPSIETAFLMGYSQSTYVDNRSKFEKALNYVLGVETAYAPGPETVFAPEGYNDTFWSLNGPGETIGQFSDLADVFTSVTGKNLNGTEATISEKSWAYAGIFLPFVSGSGVKKVIGGTTETIKGITKTVESSEDLIMLEMRQNSVGLKFKQDIPGFSQSGQKVSDVIEGLKRGDIKPNELPINYVNIDGRNIILNNKSFSAIKGAGVTPIIKDVSNLEWAQSFGRDLLNRSDGNIFDFLNVSK